MKWRKETKVYMWANYYSEDGNWKAWDEEKVIVGGGRKKVYNPETKKMVYIKIVIFVLLKKLKMRK